MVEATELLSVVVISARAGIDATKTGAAMNIDAAEINRTPSVSHSIADMLRMNPQVRSDNNGAMFFLGTNNRYNSFRIDGTTMSTVWRLTAPTADRPAHNRYPWKPLNRYKSISPPSTYANLVSRAVP